MAESKPEAGRFRTILPQILASTAKNLLILDLGLAVAFPTIVIPALRRTVQRSGVVEPLFFTDVQASWFASISYICQPIGSILSGWVSEPLGRKRAMIVVNIPHIIAWILLHYGNSYEVMYLGAILLGLGVGFMEAPIITYVGEICQPSIRGILISCAELACTLGVFIVYLLGSLTDWRSGALICLSIPLFTAAAISFVPETPMWLLSKQREEDALKSLQWLRGWVSPKAVEKEFNEMIRYNENSNKCNECEKAQITCQHPPPTFFEKLMQLKRKRTLKAFGLVIIIFGFSQFSGLPAMTPFLVQLFKAYGAAIDPSWGAVYVGIVCVISNITCMIVIRFLGKRRLCLIGFTGTVISCITLGIYAEKTFPPGYNSFDEYRGFDQPRSIIPLVAFLILAFCASISTSIPWMLVSEVFPFKSRGLAAGITAGINYILTFISTKTYLNLDKGLSLNGTMWFFTTVNILGILYVFFFLPETENRTLEDIEAHFSQNNRKLTDIKIKQVETINQERTNGVDSGNQRGCDNKAYVEN